MMDKMAVSDLERILNFVQSIPGKASFQLVKLENGAWELHVTDTEPIFEEMGTTLPLALAKMSNLVYRSQNQTKG